jgi:pantothenate kinase-related protein Tda10/FMN phosphatase YigB (HAD superfamily)
MQKLNKNNKIKIVMFDLYGTILKQKVGDLEDSTNIENEKKLLKSFEKLKQEYKNSKNKINLSSKELKKLFLGFINSSHKNKKNKGINFPEVKIEKIWHSILKKIDHPQKNNKNFWFEIADNHQKFIAKRTLYKNSSKIFDYCIKNNIKLGIISNAQFYTEKDLLKLLKTTQEFKDVKSIYDVFEKDLCFFSYKIGFSKPNTKIFDLVNKKLSSYNISMNESLFVGNDVFNDIYSGNQSNMQTCLVINPETKYRKNDERLKKINKNKQSILKVADPTAAELRGIKPLSETALGSLQTELPLQSNGVLNPVCNKLKPSITIKDFDELIKIFEKNKLQNLEKLNRFYSTKELEEIVIPIINLIQERRNDKLKKTLDKKLNSSVGNKKPFFISIQGGQGTGKTTFAKFLSDFFKTYGLSSICFSIDDYYLPAEKRKKINKANKDNPYYNISRGSLGTHDIVLLQKTLQSLYENKKTTIINFDKSLLKGYGERSNKKTIVKNPDIVIFEGYCNNIPKTNIKILKDICNKHKIDLSFDPNLRYSKKILEKIKDYEILWNYFDISISLKEDKPELSVKWKIQQEKMFRKNVSIKQIKNFVKIFQPITYLCYEKSNFDLKILINSKHELYKIIKKE